MRMQDCSQKCPQYVCTGYPIYHCTVLFICPGRYEPLKEPFSALPAMVLSGDLCSGEYKSGELDEKDLSSVST